MENKNKYKNNNKDKWKYVWEKSTWAFYDVGSLIAVFYLALERTLP